MPKTRPVARLREERGVNQRAGRGAQKRFGSPSQTKGVGEQRLTRQVIDSQWPTQNRAARPAGRHRFLGSGIVIGGTGRFEVRHREIRALRTTIDQWDSGKNRELVARRITERLARVPFHLIATADDGVIAIAYRPTLLIDAIWQQFAREAAGVITCAKCAAPNCGRWFLRSQTRSDRQYCSSTCRMRAWRQGGKGATESGLRASGALPPCSSAARSRGSADSTVVPIWERAKGPRRFLLFAGQSPMY